MSVDDKWGGREREREKEIDRERKLEKRPSPPDSLCLTCLLPPSRSHFLKFLDPPQLAPRVCDKKFPTQSFGRHFTLKPKYQGKKCILDFWIFSLKTKQFCLFPHEFTIFTSPNSQTEDVIVTHMKTGAYLCAVTFSPEENKWGTIDT